MLPVAEDGEFLAGIGWPLWTTMTSAFTVGSLIYGVMSELAWRKLQSETKEVSRRNNIGFYWKEGCIGTKKPRRSGLRTLIRTGSELVRA